MREGMRLVSVVLGSTSMKARENASAALLGYGFTFYDTKLIVKGGTALAPRTSGRPPTPSAELGIKDDLYMTLPRGSLRCQNQVDVTPKLIAPLAIGRDVGTLRVINGKARPWRRMPLHPLKPVAAGGWWRRLIDTIRLWFA
jgi:D-alanyl-D-alanine carboxypeptidase (penicillin-binding protein 5/6)